MDGDYNPPLSVKALSRKGVELCSAPPFTNVAPHWAPKSVTNVSLLLLVLLDTLQLATGAAGLSSQGPTAVVHGCSIRTLGHNLGKEITFIMATLQEGTQSAGKYTRLHS